MFIKNKKLIVLFLFLFLFNSIFYIDKKVNAGIAVDMINHGYGIDISPATRTNLTTAKEPTARKNIFKNGGSFLKVFIPTKTKKEWDMFYAKPYGGVTVCDYLSTDLVNASYVTNSCSIACANSQLYKATAKECYACAYTAYSNTTCKSTGYWFQTSTTKTTGAAGECLSDSRYGVTPCTYCTTGGSNSQSCALTGGYGGVGTQSRTNTCTNNNLSYGTYSACQVTGCAANYYKSSATACTACATETYTYANNTSPNCGYGCSYNGWVNTTCNSGNQWNATRTIIQGNATQCTATSTAANGSCTYCASAGGVCATATYGTSCPLGFTVRAYGAYACNYSCWGPSDDRECGYTSTCYYYACEKFCQPGNYCPASCGAFNADGSCQTCGSYSTPGDYCGGLTGGTTACMADWSRTCNDLCGDARGVAGACGFFNCQCKKYQLDVCNSSKVCSSCKYPTTWTVPTCISSDCVNKPVYADPIAPTAYSSCPRIYNNTYVVCNAGCGGTTPTEPQDQPDPPPDATPPSSGGCFTEDTLVKTTTGEKQIKDIKEGDYVIGFDTRKNITIESKVKELLVHDYLRSEYYEIKTNNSFVKVNEVHPFYIGNNMYKKVMDLKVGDTIYVLKDGKLIQDIILEKNLVKLDYVMPYIYNLKLEGGVQTYSADGYLVHTGDNYMDYTQAMVSKI